MAPQVLVARLNNGMVIPALGLGTWQLKDPQIVHDVATAALHSGYHLIDTAQVYHNQEFLGKAVGEFTPNQRKEVPNQTAQGTPFELISEADFLKTLNKDSNAVFITGKVFTKNYTPEGVRSSVEDHLSKLGRTSADLYLMHWPGPLAEWSSETEQKSSENAQTRLTVWHTLEELVAEGKLRAIGVSNFMCKHLEPLVKDVLDRKAKGDKKAVLPVVDQIECSPIVQPAAELEALCSEHKILITSYSTLGSSEGNVRNDKHIVEMAKKLNRTNVQVLLRWALQRGWLIIPRTSNPVHCADNLAALQFSLSDDEMKHINDMPAGDRVCGNPYDVA